MLGFPILYLKGMRIRMFQLSGFYLISRSPSGTYPFALFLLCPPFISKRVTRKQGTLTLKGLLGGT